MIELLAPAGSPESARAAVQSGADAIYLGAEAFNARRNAANFDRETLRITVEDCHLRGVKVYLTVNTLLYDRELEDVADLIRYASAIGVDALLVQDLGVMRLAKQVAPDLPLHASTQMTIHDLEGAKMAADMGMTRVVLSRELSRDQIGYICAHSPVEIEVFVHGALCMCYSGQCFFSSVIGGRSGNRGMCAQPCRLNYGWRGKANKPLLSLKDMSLAQHMRELDEMGVACAKLEGRMKRPEYVAIVTKVYADAIREHRDPTADELERLRLAFSRQGFTDGYFMDKTGPEMFGIHEKNPLPELLFAETRRLYAKENPRVNVDISATIRSGDPVKLTLSDQDGHKVTVEGDVPEQARMRSIMSEQVEKQITKLGGTPYVCRKCTTDVEHGLSLPLSSLNGLRREALEQLSAKRVALPLRRKRPYEPVEKLPNRKDEPVYTVFLHSADQLSDGLLRQKPEIIALPLEELQNNQYIVSDILQYGIECSVVLPRILWDRERPAARKALEELRDLGVSTAYASTLSGIRLAEEAGLGVRGDFGLGVLNSGTLFALKDMGLQSATVSFELKSQRVRDLSKPLPTELLVYGRFPLMVMENCIIKNRTGKCACRWKTGQENLLTDRVNAAFPVDHAYGCRNEIFNSAPLWLEDKREFWQRSGIWAARLNFTFESAKECERILAAYKNGGGKAPEKFTRGLYFRDVE